MGLFHYGVKGMKWNKKLRDFSTIDFPEKKITEFSGKTLQEILDIIKPFDNMNFNMSIDPETRLSGKKLYIYNQLKKLVESGKINEIYLNQYLKSVQHSISGDIMNELQHTGVLGMKWGVRKQTKATKKAISLTKNKEQFNDLSMDELRDLANRLNTERQISLIGSQEIENSKGIIKRSLNVIGNRLLENVNRQIADSLFNILMQTNRGKQAKQLLENLKQRIDKNS